MPKKNTSKTIELFASQIQEKSYDFKASVLANQAIDNGISNENIIVRSDAFFERPYNKDVDSAEVIVDEWFRTFLELRLTRPGFYDMLPEGIFFQPQSSDFKSSSQFNIEEEVFKYRRDKQIEANIRKFFQPIENEFFQQEIKIEHWEGILTKEITPRTDIWNLPKDISENDKITFTLLIPDALHINGNIRYMQEALRYILQEKVIIERKITQKSYFSDPMLLGTFELGNDMVCGEEFWEDDVNLNYKIGPLKKLKLVDFLNSGKGQILIETFDNFFAPLDANTTYEILLSKDEQTTILNEKREPILGFSTIL